MSIKTIMVVLEADADNDQLIRSAIGWAGHLQARLIGMAAYQDIPIVYNDGFVGADIIRDDQAAIDRKIAATRERFLSLAGDASHRADFRSAIVSLSLASYVARQARIADLLVARPFEAHRRISRSVALNANDLVIHAGRPLLMLPDTTDFVPPKAALIAWKDSRESRRAVCDALPMLRSLERVVVAALAEGDTLQETDEAAADVVSWLGRHGIEAVPRTARITGDVAGHLAILCREQNVDLLVGGAYAHSRLQEFVLGGVTRDLLMTPPCCTLLSH
jgi:nucleotide-binding universal stress UspA family protein